MLKEIVEPSQASMIACRKLPSPVFAFEMTIGLVRQETIVTFAEEESLTEFKSFVSADRRHIVVFSLSRLTGM